MDKEKLVEKFIKEKMPLTGLTDNGLIKQVVFNFIEWQESRKLTFEDSLRSVLDERYSKCQDLIDNHNGGELMPLVLAATYVGQAIALNTKTE